jgi:hypothetical protein
MLETPVALIIFNRPDTTARVFAEIAKTKPRHLLVIADGPRADRPGETERCAATRAVIEGVDWKCDVSTNFSEVNLGCGRRVSTGIGWVFEQVEEAIVLEDDCVPHPTFFRFCEEMLQRYRDDERVMHVGAGGFQFGRTQRPFSYFFSKHCPVWGWASWRRAWRHYDVALGLWPMLRDTAWLRDILDDEQVIEHWRRVLDLAHASIDNVNTWDFQWTFACWAQNGLSVLPHRTLVSNVGFRDDATHTRTASDPLGNISTTEMIFPLRHPPYVLRDQEADRVFVDHVLRPYLRRQPTLYSRLRQRCAQLVPPRARRSVKAAVAALRQRSPLSSGILRGRRSFSRVGRLPDR